MQSAESQTLKNIFITKASSKNIQVQEWSENKQCSLEFKSMKSQPLGNRIDGLKQYKLPIISSKKSFSIKNNNQHELSLKRSNKSTLDKHRTQINDQSISATDRKTQIFKKTHKLHRLIVLSNMTKRNVESLLQKYQAFLASLDNLLTTNPNKNLEDLLIITNQRKNYYTQLLLKQTKRHCLSAQEEECLHHNRGNLKIRKQVEKDWFSLQIYAKEINSYLYRKGRFYSPLQDIRKKLEKISIKLQFQGNTNRQRPQITQALKEGESLKAIHEQVTISDDLKQKAQNQPTKKQFLYNRKVMINQGNQNLSYSRKIGLHSKQIQKKQKGKVKLIKELVHYYGFKQ